LRRPFSEDFSPFALDVIEFLSESTAQQLGSRQDVR
jgi:hypothetical protein